MSENALGSKGVLACEPLLQPRPSLQRLFFCNNGMSAEACALIAELLLARGGVSGLSRRVCVVLLR